MHIIIALASSLLPFPIVEDTCDCIEINHYYNDSGEKVWTQLIAWDRTKDGYRVAWWKMKPACQIDSTTRGYIVKLQTDNLGVVTVRARSFKETHTQVDHEILDRTNLPQDRRRGLRGCMR